MEDELLSLKWNNHKTTFLEILKIQREKFNYTDATLAVEGKFYPVHKLVMSTCSEYFSDIFEKTPCKSPVIVLKDVQSHDIEALLDYMYLGEVNVKQIDLASLVKTAECLRIKGLAVPDEDPTKLHKNSPNRHSVVHQDSPPSKRRRNDSNTISPHAASPVPSSEKSATALINTTQIPSIPPHSTYNTEQNEPPVVKVEMDNAEEQGERYKRENNYEGGASRDRDTIGNYGSDHSKTEHEPENYGNTSFPGPSLLQSEDHWDVGDSSSFPPESYSDDVPISQQAQGGGWCIWGSDDQNNTFIGRNHPCNVCPKRFRTKQHLRRHMRCHTGEKPFGCPHCSYRTTQKGHLRGHILRKHLPVQNLDGNIESENSYLRKHLPVQNLDGNMESENSYLRKYLPVQNLDGNIESDNSYFKKHFPVQNLDGNIESENSFAGSSISHI